MERYKSFVSSTWGKSLESLTVMAEYMSDALSV